MDELEAVNHFLVLEIFHGALQLAGVKAKLAAVATALLPLAAAAARQLDANANVGANVQALGNRCDELELIKFLHNEENATSHLLRQQSELDIVFVLIAVANYERVLGNLAHIHCQNGMKLGLRTCFQTYVELSSVAHNLLYHGLHLVNLDGIDDEVLCLIIIFLGCFLKATRNFLDTIVKDIRKSQQHGCADVALPELVHHFH